MTATAGSEKPAARAGRVAASPGDDGARPALLRALEPARDRWSGLGVTDAAFIAYVDSRVGTEDDRPAAIDDLHVADLYLACAAVGGNPVAIEEIDRLVHSEVVIALRASAGADAIDEIRQRISIRLLCPDDGTRPRLEQFRGKASLRSWLRVIATRELYRTTRAGSLVGPASDDRVWSAVCDDDGPLLLLLKHEHRARFKRAFQAAFCALSIYDRGLLRQHYGDGLGIEQMARIHGTHRATVARKLARVRAKLVAAAQRSLVAAAELASCDLHAEQLGTLVDSQLDLSLSRLFAELPPGA